MLTIELIDLFIDLVEDLAGLCASLHLVGELVDLVCVVDAGSAICKREQGGWNRGNLRKNR